MNSETKKTLKFGVSTIDVNLKKLRTELAQNEVHTNNFIRAKKTLVDKIGELEKKKKEIVEDLQKEENS